MRIQKSGAVSGNIIVHVKVSGQCGNKTAAATVADHAYIYVIA